LLGPPEIQVTVTEAEFLVYFRGHLGIIDRERQDIGCVEHFEAAGADLDFAGRNFGVIGACGARADDPGHRHDAFGAEGGGLLEEFGGKIGGIKNGLGAAFAVADVDEDQPAEIAAGMDPAAEGDFEPGVRGA